MLNHLFFIILPVASLICWPELLADGLPTEPPARLAKRTSRIVIVQTPENASLPPRHRRLTSIVRPVEPLFGESPARGIPMNHKHATPAARLTAPDWRERLRQEQSIPLRKEVSTFATRQ